MPWDLVDAASISVSSNKADLVVNSLVYTLETKAAIHHKLVFES